MRSLFPVGTKYWRNRVMKVANEFKSKVMNYAIASKEDYSNDFDSLGLSSEGDDPVVSIKSDDGSKYAMKEKFRYHFTAYKAFFLSLLLLSTLCILQKTA